VNVVAVMCQRVRGYFPCRPILEPEKLDYKLTNSEIQLPQLKQTVNYSK